MSIDWNEARRNAYERKTGGGWVPRKKEYPVDELISRIVKKEVRTNDPRLMAAAAERNRLNNDDMKQNIPWESATGVKILRNHFK